MADHDQGEREAKEEEENDGEEIVLPQMYGMGMWWIVELKTFVELY